MTPGAETGAETRLQDVRSRADMTTPGVNSIMIELYDWLFCQFNVYRNNGLLMYSVSTSHCSYALSGYLERQSIYRFQWFMVPCSGLPIEGVSQSALHFTARSIASVSIKSPLDLSVTFTFNDEVDIMFTLQRFCDELQSWLSQLGWGNCKGVSSWNLGR